MCTKAVFHHNNSEVLVNAIYCIFLSRCKTALRVCFLKSSEFQWCQGLFNTAADYVIGNDVFVLVS